MDTEGIRERLEGIISQIVEDLERLPERDGKEGLRAALEELERIVEAWLR